MKGWLLVTSCGIYEDYTECYDKCYLDYNEAKKQMDKYNLKLDKKEEQRSKCSVCKINYSKNITYPSCDKYCKYKNMEYDKECDNEYSWEEQDTRDENKLVGSRDYSEFYCKNCVGYDLVNEHYCELKEIEIIEKGAI